MITREEVDIAKQQIIDCQKLIDAYNKQQDEIWLKKRKDIEDACTEHEYVYTNTKWQSQSQRKCINCGKIID